MTAATSLRGRAAVVGVAESELGEVAAGDRRARPDRPGGERGARRGRDREERGRRRSSPPPRSSPPRPCTPASTSASAPATPTAPTSAAPPSSATCCTRRRRSRPACAEVALIVYGSTQRSQGGFASPNRLSPYEAPFGPRWPLTMYALAAARHMHEFGTTREQLAEVAVAARQWAQLNPKAFEREPADGRGRARLADDLRRPLHLLDCCLVTDGGGALVVTSAERARELRRSRPPTCSAPARPTGTATSRRCRT